MYTFPLSFAQQRIWLLTQLESHGAAYHISDGFTLSGPLRIDALEQSLNEIVARHEVLRTTFAVLDGKPVQVVVPERSCELPVTDIRALPSAARDARLGRMAREHACAPFDLAAGPLARFQLVQVEEERHVLLCTMHHLITDGWSEGVFLKELVALYLAFGRGEESPLPELPIQYGDFSVWEREWLQGEALDSLLAYWKEQLAGAPDVLDIPTDRPRPTEPSYRGAVEVFSLPEGVRRALAELSRSEETSLYATLLAAFGILLHRRSGQDHVLIGSPVANRGQVELEGLIGLFLNTVILRVDLSGNPTFRELLRRVREATYGAQEHQDLPFERLLTALRPVRDRGRNPLFQVFFNLENSTVAGSMPPSSELVFEPFQIATGSAKLDLILNVQETGSGLVGSMEYATDLFDASTIRRMIGEFRVLLDGIVAAPDRAVGDLPLLDEAEVDRLVAEWNATARTDYPHDACVHELFELRAARHPDTVAVAGGGEELTYAALNRRANQLARYLTGRGVRPEVPVAVCMDRSPDLVVAVLGVLKAGGVYLPIDPTIPEERARYLLADAGVHLVLTQSRRNTPIPQGEAEIFRLDTDAAELAALGGEDVGRRTSPDNLAYVIYTSGSTGRPKGVMVPHRGVVNYLSWCLEAYPVQDGEGALLHGSVAVDMSITTLFTPLLAGRSLVLLDAEGGMEELGAALRSGRRFSFVKLTPTHLQVLNPAVTPDGTASTAALIVGGEALLAESLALWRGCTPGVRIINEYGPTETVVGCCVHEVTDADPETGPIPIGRPVANTRLYVLDASLRPVPVGVTGELYIGGAQVTRGYLGRPRLTAEGFLPDPFSPTPGERIYRTGDLARYRPDGILEYLGRGDRQVKIRGFRIEPGEIEMAILEHPSIREAAVLAREDVTGERRLVAYVAAEAQLSTEEVLASLRPKLPEHMLPTAVVSLDSLPLTPSGKVDRKALPAPVAELPRSGPGFVAPRTVVEDTLASIWSRVLQMDSVGVHDNFFAIGGDSIRSLMVAGLARERGLSLSIRQIARTPTIAELAAQLRAGQTTVESEVHVEPFSMISAEDRARLPEGVVDAYPLARMQLGMLYHRDRTPNAPLFHSINSHHLRMEWDREKFDAAVLHITERHANLRTSFDLANYSEPLQLVQGEAVFPVGFFDLRHLSESEHRETLRVFWRAEKQRPFDLTRPPQLRFHIHQRSDDRVQFTLTENHAVVDGWSLHVIFEEILTCYFALLRGEGFPQLPELKTSFRDFIHLERKAMESGEAEEFWRRKLAGYSVTQLPRLPGHRPDYDRARVLRLDRVLPVRLHARLRRLAREEAVPLKSVLLAAHLKVMSFLAGEDDIVTGLSSNGRPETSDAGRVCGLFLNTLPIRLDLRGGSWRELVRRSYEAELELLPVRRYPMAEVQSKWGSETLYDTSFVYLNFHAFSDHARSGEVEYVEAGAMIEETNFAVMTAFMHLPGYASQVGLSLCCDRWVFTDVQIRRIAGYYFRTLETMVSDPAGRHDTFAPLSEEERHELAEWSAGNEVVDPLEPVHRQFERHAAHSPDLPCLDLGREQLSFGEVDRWANRIAHDLRSRGVGAESRVAVAIDRAPELVPALLGVLKAGAAYVPVDPSHPEDRVRFVLRDAGAATVLTLDEWRPRLADAGVEVVSVDGDRPRIKAHPPGESPAAEVELENLAYVIYTSGTTGRSKGVAVEHRQLAAYVAAAIERLELPAGGDYALISTFTADLANTMLFPALCTGGCLHVLSEREATDPNVLAERLSRRPVDCLKIVPSHLRALLAHSEPARLLPRRRLVLGGEAVEWELVERVQELAPCCRTFNHYGPTETTVGVLAGELARGDESHAGRPPLGLSLANTRAYVLDSHLRPVPVGTAGELYISGATVSRGYLGRPALTAEKFIPDPFSSDPDTRMYASGDRVRCLHAGRVEFLGRVDDQMKIRGFRVEPREAEAALREHPEVAECAVVGRQDGGEGQLVGYVVAAAGAAPPTDEALRAFLARMLPSYAVPARFVRIEALPLTPNGKLDRKALPALEGGGERGEAHVEPRTSIEERLVQIWTEILKVDRLGVYDGFFELGGDSIRAILAAARVRQTFGVDLSVEALFQAQTVAGLAGAIEMAIQAQGSRSTMPIVPVSRDGELPLSSSQQRFWYADLLEPGSPAQNVPCALRLRGPLDTAALQGALDDVVRRHEVLRTRFPTVDGLPWQVIVPPAALELRRVDLIATTPPAVREEVLLAAVREEAWTPFDLEHGPLLRGLLARVDEEDHALVLTTHHIIFDGWSVGLFLREIGELYTAFREGKPSPLPELPVQYADYVHWQRERFRDEVLETQIAYWQRQLAEIPTLELTTDRARPPVQTYRGGVECVGFSQELAERMKQMSQREGVSLFMSLLAAYTVLLHHRSGAEDIVVGSPMATHRDRDELQGVIGCFLNTLALRIDLAGNPSFRELLSRVRRVALEGYSNQELPFEKLVETLRFKRDVSRSPIFQVWFNHSNVSAGHIRFSGLKVGAVDVGDVAVKFDLQLTTEENGGRLAASLRYNSDLFDRATARELMLELKMLLGRVAEEPDVRLSELRSLLVEEARARRTRAWGERGEALRRGLLGAKRRAISIQT